MTNAFEAAFSRSSCFAEAGTTKFLEMGIVPDGDLNRGRPP